jgi:GPH family glycoside/pentoside/hexuronide:cation symporter
VHPSNSKPANDSSLPSQQAAPRLTVKEKVSYGIGDVSNGLAVSSVSVWYLYYLTDIVGLMAVYASAALMIGRLWDAVTDPVMGWISDHTRSRWGKRLPYLLFGAIPYAISYFALMVNSGI